MYTYMLNTQRRGRKKDGGDGCKEGDCVGALTASEFMIPQPKISDSDVLV